MQDFLEDSGYEVEVAYDGHLALAYLSKETPLSVIVTDIRLGQGPNGWEVARHARAKEPDLPIVYVSGDCAHEFGQLGVPGSRMLQKPFQSAELLSALSKAIAGRAASSSSER
jgi:CheY-like chemotaxis protein